MTKTWTLARVLLSLTAAYGGIGAYIADWNKTHIHNPTWPPHAKFHNAQSMSLGAALLGLTLVAVWRRPRLSRGEFRLATALASTYCASQLSALLYPGTALIDPPSTKKGPQAIIASVALGINAMAYAIGRPSAGLSARSGRISR